ncbi:MAG: thioredoxin domain-containing protein, partial [Aquihabitans sp.]
MLPDQALLARVYLHAWQIAGEDRFRRTLDQTMAYVLRDLRHGSGGFHAAEDADSENVEGKFYVWSSEEIRQVLGPGADPILEWWGVTSGGNFEGTNILNRIHGDPVDPEPDVVSHARRRLLEVRGTRIRPGLDDKVLTEWNALMLATLAEAGAATGNRAWLDAAVANGEFLLANLRRSDGRWMRSWQDDGQGGAARHLGLAADYAALLDGFTRLGEATGRSRWIEAARTVADQLLHLFWDHDNRGLFTTAHHAEKLLARSKDLLDTATPSANSQAALGLLRLAALTGEATYHDHAVEIIEVLSTIAVENPTAVAHLLAAVDLSVHGIDEVAIVGNEPAMVTAVQAQYLPGAVLAWGEPYPSPLWDDRRNGLAYVCRNFTCLAPVTTAKALIERLAPVQVHRSPADSTRTDSAGDRPPVS